MVKKESRTDIRRKKKIRNRFTVLLETRLAVFEAIITCMHRLLMIRPDIL